RRIPNCGYHRHLHASRVAWNLSFEIDPADAHEMAKRMAEVVGPRTSVSRGRDQQHRRGYAYASMWHPISCTQKHFAPSSKNWPKKGCKLLSLGARKSQAIQICCDSTSCL